MAMHMQALHFTRFTHTQATLPTRAAPAEMVVRMDVCAVGVMSER
jgi:hypothetical protein